jgi:hypothetical protein
MNEAVITFVMTETAPDVNDPFVEETVVYTKVVRIEFEGTPEAFLQSVDTENADLKVVSIETLKAE